MLGYQFSVVIANNIKNRLSCNSQKWTQDYQSEGQCNVINIYPTFEFWRIYISLTSWRGYRTASKTLWVTRQWDVMSKITQNLVGGGHRVRWCRCAAELVLVWPRAIVAVNVAYHDQHAMNEPLLESVKHSSEQCYTSNVPFLLFDFRPRLHSIQYELWKHSFVTILTMKCLTIARTQCCSIFLQTRANAFLRMRFLSVPCNAWFSVLTLNIFA